MNIQQILNQIITDTVMHCIKGKPKLLLFCFSSAALQLTSQCTAEQI